LVKEDGVVADFVDFSVEEEAEGAGAAGWVEVAGDGGVGLLGGRLLDVGKGWRGSAARTAEACPALTPALSHGR
jgi:hypothetical protein